MSEIKKKETQIKKEEFHFSTGNIWEYAIILKANTDSEDYQLWREIFHESFTKLRL